MGPRSAGNQPPYSLAPPRPPDLDEMRRKRIQIAKEQVGERTDAWRRELEKTMASFRSEIINELRQFHLERPAQVMEPSGLTSSVPILYQHQPPPLLDGAVSTQPNNSPASFFSVSGTNTSVSNPFNCHKDDCGGMGFVFGANGIDEKLENGESVEKRAEVTSGDGRGFSELECVIAKWDEGGLVTDKEQLSNGRSEFHALQLFDKMPNSEGLCDARRTGLCNAGRVTVPVSSGSQSSSKLNALDSLSAFTMQPSGGQFQRPQAPSNSSPQVSAAGPSSFASPAISVGVGNSTSENSQPPWPKMKPSDVQKYTKVFMEVDTDRDGKITGERARNLFLSWRLPREVLKQVWDLSDQDNDNMLSLREFCFSLYLMERYREGRPLPATLPSNVMLDETLLSMIGQPKAGYGNAAWSPHSGFGQHQGLQGSQMMPPGTALRPPTQGNAPQADRTVQLNQQNLRVLGMEGLAQNQLDNGRQDSANSRHHDPKGAGKEVEESKNVILDSREKIGLYRTKMQELVLYKSRCDNRLNEITERALADKREAELLGKKYEEKYKQVAEIASKLTIEEVTFREVQERKMELHQAIVKMEQGGSADGILQVRADRIQYNLEELIKALNERCKKKHGLDMKSAAIIEFPTGWQPGIQDGAAVWDEEWDKFEDEGFGNDLIIDSSAKSVQREKASPDRSSTADSSSVTDGKSGISYSNGDHAHESESFFTHGEDEHVRSPNGSLAGRTAVDSPSRDFSDIHYGKNSKADVSNIKPMIKSVPVEGHEGYDKSNESLQVNFDASDAGINQTTHSIGPDDNDKDGNCDGSGESGNHSRKRLIEEHLLANTLVTVQFADPYENQICPAANLHKDDDDGNFEKIFASIPEVSIFSWNVNLIATCVKFGETKSGHQLFDNTLCSNVSSWNAILFGYFQNEDHMEVKHIFHNMQDLDACWNTKIAGFSVNSQDKEVFTYRNMRQHEMFPTHFSYAPILSWCAKLASSFQEKQNTSSLASIKISFAKVFVMEADEKNHLPISRWLICCLLICECIKKVLTLAGKGKLREMVAIVNWFLCAISEFGILATLNAWLKELVKGDQQLQFFVTSVIVFVMGGAFTSLELLQNECQIDQANAKAMVASAIIQLHLNEATELILSNGMRACYKSTKFLDDQVIFTGFSYGGLFELVASEYFSCSMGPSIAGDIGVYGCRPSVLMNMLASWLYVSLRYCFPPAIPMVTTFLLSVALVMCVTARGVMKTIEKAHTDEFAEKAMLLPYGISDVGKGFIYDILCLQLLLDLVGKMLQTWTWENTKSVQTHMTVISFLCFSMVIIKVDEVLEFSSRDKELIKENSTCESVTAARVHLDQFKALVRGVQILSQSVKLEDKFLLRGLHCYENRLK